MHKKVFVSGCFDLLHSGHIQFFKSASEYGDVYVAVGTDQNVVLLKGKTPINPQVERLFMVRSVKYVKKAFIATGSGVLDFSGDLENIKPDIFIVNEDGDKPNKRQLCRNLGIKYLVLKRKPAPGLPVRSTTKLKADIPPAILKQKKSKQTNLSNSR